MRPDLPWPWLIAIVVGLSLILLVVLVRSVTIAFKAALMTLLSTAATYGVLTAIVQWGWLGLHRLRGLPHLPYPGGARRRPRHPGSGGAANWWLPQPLQRLLQPTVSPLTPPVPST